MNIVPAIVMFLVGLLIGLLVWYRSGKSSRDERENLRIEIARLESQSEADSEKMKWVEQAEAKMREAFEALASKALRANSDTLTQQAKDDLKNLVTPLKDGLTSLDKQVQDLEKTREGAYGKLSQQLTDLGEAQVRLQETTTSLKQALRSPTVRGRWGELQLRRVVELAGMVSHVSFDEQASGEAGRPDMVVYLPNQGMLPVDAKVPLNSYLAAMEAEDPDARRANLAAHAKALRDTVRELGQKQYWEQFATAPEFVIMFVPSEACLGAAFEVDAALLEYAIEKKVLISSPVNLVALLRAVAYGWQQHEISDNARRIADEARELYGRMDTFVTRLEEVGRSLNKTVEVYNRAVGSYERRLLPSARRFREMGVGGSEMIEPPRLDVQATAPAPENEPQSA
jgi:DNA recombination protein RmuC